MVNCAVGGGQWSVVSGQWAMKRVGPEFLSSKPGSSSNGPSTGRPGSTAAASLLVKTLYEDILGSRLVVESGRGGLLWLQLEDPRIFWMDQAVDKGPE